MTKFEVGKKYFMSSVCDHECVWRYEVVSRTAKTVTLQKIGDLYEKKPIKRRIYEFEGVECVKPLGSYSMAPVLMADQVWLGDPVPSVSPETSVAEPMGDPSVRSVYPGPQ